MEGSSLLSSLSSSSARPTYFKALLQFNINLQRPSCNSSSCVEKYRYLIFIPKFLPKPHNYKNSAPRTSSGSSLGTCAFALPQGLYKSHDSISTVSPREMLPNIDKSGRFCSPRAARELAL
ncbi:hypothetical protein L6164_015150 [Bauhinia variegata]|nr:hypothetical protein L6164_015150 [Bauhinia variegata]